MKTASEFWANKSNYLCSIGIFLLWFFLCRSVAVAEEHIVEKGDTALQIAIDHDLTMEQLSRLNPDKDLEMMRVGDVLILPDQGQSFEEFLEKSYSERIRTEGLNCQIAADRSAFCLFHAENLSDLPLNDVRLRASVRGIDGRTGSADAAIALMQILPGEKLPVVINVPGNFSGIESASVSVQQLSWSEILTTSVRVPEDLYAQTTAILPDGIGAAVTILFNREGAEANEGRKINILAAAYDSEDTLVGVRSLYSDFYSRLDLTVYSVGPVIDKVNIFMEAY